MSNAGNELPSTTLEILLQSINGLVQSQTNFMEYQKERDRRQEERDERHEREFRELKEVNIGIQQSLGRLGSAFEAQPQNNFRSQVAYAEQHSTLHSRQTPSGSTAKEQYRNIGLYLSPRTQKIEDTEQLLEFHGFKLPDLGSLDDSGSRISRIQSSFQEYYSKSTLLVIDGDGFNGCKELTTEQHVQHAMHMLLSAISSTVSNSDDRPKMKFIDKSGDRIDSKYKPDFVFVPVHSESSRWSNVGVVCELKSISNRDANVLNGQIGQYFNQMWMKQPRKLCIGVVASRGKLHILVNTRDGIDYAVVGTLPFVRHDSSSMYASDEHSQITLEPGSGELVVRVLTMLFGLDFEQCGMLAPQAGGVSQGFGLCETMETADQDDTALSVVVGGDIQQAPYRIRLPGNGYLGGRVVYPVGTTSWVHKAEVAIAGERESHVHSAVVKIQWCRSKRPTEKRIYDLLREAAIPNVPGVFFGGQIETGGTTTGTRCNILAVEDCGVGISQYACILAQQPSVNHWQLLDIACGYIHTIYAAWAGKTTRILHRDISSGNLMVRDNLAMVIDWEYALFANVTKQRQLVSSHPLTGTLAYASMGVLSGGTMRSATDDIESLFYVLAHAIEAAQHSDDGRRRAPQDKGMQKLWSGSTSEDDLRQERRLWFGSSDTYKSRLGESCPRLWWNLLLSMYNILDISRHSMASGVILRTRSVKEYVQQLVLALQPVLQAYGAEARHFTRLVEFGQFV
ncbi:hypothetical protein EV178_005864 [Coemansia sp. RSA 1646]|nr:hypothetical protein EV178_005864 [Coemansia sp. RSA 1646]